MQKEIKAKLEELVTLMNDPETTVIEAEVVEKLEKILELVKDPEESGLEKKELTLKLEKVVEQVGNASVDPDIDIEYFNNEEEPYMLVTYVVSEYNKPTRKIYLKDSDLRRNSAEDLVNQITFSIEEFKGEIDSVEMG